MTNSTRFCSHLAADSTHPSVYVNGSHLCSSCSVQELYKLLEQQSPNSIPAPVSFTRCQHPRSDPSEKCGWCKAALYAGLLAFWSYAKSQNETTLANRLGQTIRTLLREHGGVTFSVFDAGQNWRTTNIFRGTHTGCSSIYLCPRIGSTGCEQVPHR